MNTLDVIQKTREYLDYLENHVKMVQQVWAELRVNIWDSYFIDAMNKEIEAHDLSKLSEEEFVQYRRRFFPAHEEPSGGLSEWKEAVNHHYANNSHHLESPMYHSWLKDNVHLACDWIAMSRRPGAASVIEYMNSRSDVPGAVREAVKYVLKIVGGK